MSADVPEFETGGAANIKTQSTLGGVTIEARPWMRNPLLPFLWQFLVLIATTPIGDRILLRLAVIAVSFLPLILFMRVLRRDRLTLSSTTLIHETFYGPWRRSRTVTQVAEIVRAEVVGWWAWSAVRLTFSDGDYVDQYVGHTDDHRVLSEWLNGELARAHVAVDRRLPLEAADAVPEELRALGFRARDAS